MSRGCIKIHNIEIEEKNDKASLVAFIDDNGVTKNIKYTVYNKYKDYLTTERSDAFVIALLYYAMINSFDLTWEIPCDEKLIYQIKTYFIPVYEKEIPFMHAISLNGPTTKEKLYQMGGVATGFSNGVDSCYTIKKYMQEEKRQFRLTHLICTDWFLSDSHEERKEKCIKYFDKELFENSNSLGLEYVFVDFNIDEEFSIGHIKDKERGIIKDAGLHTLKYCSIALALQKLLSVFYFSSGFEVSDFTFKRDDSAYYDIFTLPLISSRVQFYSSGMELTRLEKVKYISDWEYVRKNLQVCNIDNTCNCGRCEKCIRTMGELYALGKLNEYDNRFPVEDFMNHLSGIFAKILVKASEKHSFEIEILDEINKTGKHIPIGAYVRFPFYWIYEKLRVMLKEVKFARKIYRLLNMDVKIYGKKTYSKYLDDEKK